MSKLSKIIMGAATPEQIADMLCKVAELCSVEIPSTPEYWKFFTVRVEGSIRKCVAGADVLAALQDAHNNAMRF